MAEAPELEITIEGHDDAYRADLRLSYGDDLMEVEHGVALPMELRALRRAVNDAAAYGTEVGRMFAVPKIAEFLRRGIDRAEGERLRIRLIVQPTAAELQGVRWELAHDAEGPLMTRGTIAFSRFLSSMRWFQTRPAARLSLLAAVADPKNLGDYNLAPIDRERELELIREVAGDRCRYIQLEGPCSLRNLMVQLRDGVDVLYLVCHGQMAELEPHLWLEDEEKNSAVLDGRAFISRLNDLRRPPRLIVLASCQSAGTGAAPRAGDGSVLAALGPRLVESGIPAVVAMQGEVEVATVRQFFPVFFKELAEHGSIDGAMAAARATVRDAPDWWMPVLFTRLRSGRIWYTPGFENDVDWGHVITGIQDGNCTPVLGPDLCETIVASQRELASAVAAAERFPLAHYLSEDLARVTQYIDDARRAAHRKRVLLRAKIAAIKEKFGTALPDHLRESDVGAMKANDLARYYSDLLIAGWRILQARGEDPYSRLAAIESRLYVTADTTPLLRTALKERNRNPEEVFCPWNDFLASYPSVYDKEKYFRPTVDRPLIYYVFGQDDVPESLVTTEEEYFAFIRGIGERQDMVPNIVSRALSDSEVMFLGFGIEDWPFRSLFRTLMNQQGSALRGDYRHIAVQVDLEEGRVQDARAARKHLADHFRSSLIDIFWGRVPEFMAELQRNLEPVR